jgi:high-affinity Fe2+/Pb2+ permease
MGALGLFFIISTIFLLCVCVGIAGTYIQWQRQRNWLRIQRGELTADSRQSTGSSLGRMVNHLSVLSKRWR